MEIIRHKKPVLPEFKMGCDEIIDPKLTKYPAYECCFSSAKTTLICGGCGAGKSSWVLKQLQPDGPMAGCFHDIFLIIPESSYASIPKKQNVFGKYLEPENIYHECTEDVLKEIYERVQDNTAHKEHSLIIVDDFGNKMKQKDIDKMIETLCLKNRHLRCSVWVLTQNFYMMSKRIREIMNNTILFNTSKSMNEKFFAENMDIKDEQFRKLIKMLKTRHDFMLVNNDYKRIFVNGGDEVVFHDE